jgi:hypothetical protein
VRRRIGYPPSGGQPGWVSTGGERTRLVVAVALVLTATFPHAGPCRAGLFIEAPNLTAELPP